MNPSSGDNPQTQVDLLRIQARVEESLRRRIRSLSIELTPLGIEIHGYCDSFHIKQMAQEIVSQQTDVRIVANRLIVQYSSDQAHRRQHPPDGDSMTQQTNDEGSP